MSIKDWFEEKKKQQTNISHYAVDDKIAGLWTKCFNCNASIPTKDLEKNLMVCPECFYHFRINAKKRFAQIVDDGTFEELFAGIAPADPLAFVDTASYKSRQKSANQKTGLNDAIITGIGKIDGEETAIGIMDFEYMGGSMGSVVGEKITLIIEEAIKRRIPVVIFTASGGARMQESALSLMQMAKTSCAVSRMNDEKLLYMTVLTEPTFGGVTASFGTLGDIIIAEQGARIGFAGRRVIEQTIKQKLPADFQTAEYLMKYGQIDIVEERKNLKETISKLLKMHKKGTKNEK